MQGDKSAELTGKSTGMKVVPGDDFRYVKIEVTIEGAGKVLGVDGNNMGTFTAFERVPGQMYAQGQGIVTTADGEGAIWNGHGVGRPIGSPEGMGMSIRYSVAYQASPTGKLAALNGALFIGEFEMQGDGTFTDNQWAWK